MEKQLLESIIAQNEAIILMIRNLNISPQETVNYVLESNNRFKIMKESLKVKNK